MNSLILFLFITVIYTYYNKNYLQNEKKYAAFSNILFWLGLIFIIFVLCIGGFSICLKELNSIGK